jgi:hypothetical protein
MSRLGGKLSFGNRVPIVNRTTPEKASEFASERTGPRHEPRTMRLFRSHHPLIEIRNRNDDSLACYGTSTGDLRVMRLRPFPEPARRTIHRDTHWRHPFLNCRIQYMGKISNRIEQIFAIGKENPWNLFRIRAFTRNEGDECLNLISKNHGLPAGILRPGSI